MLVIRGVVQVLSLDVLSAVLSGIAGIGYLILGISMVFVTGGPGGYFYEPYRSEEDGIGEYVGDHCGDDYSFY